MYQLIQYVAQVNNCAQGTTENSNGSCFTNLPTIEAGQPALTAFLSVLFGVLAGIAVIIIVIQGIKFSTAQGDPQKTTDARRAIIYALVGLTVSLSAEVAVRVVLARI